MRDVPFGAGPRAPSHRRRRSGPAARSSHGLGTARPAAVHRRRRTSGGTGCAARGTGESEKSALGRRPLRPGPKAAAALASRAHRRRHQRVRRGHSRHRQGGFSSRRRAHRAFCHRRAGTERGDAGHPRARPARAPAGSRRDHRGAGWRIVRRPHGVQRRGRRPSRGSVSRPGGERRRSRGRHHTHGFGGRCPGGDSLAGGGSRSPSTSSGSTTWRKGSSRRSFVGKRDGGRTWSGSIDALPRAIRAW